MKKNLINFSMFTVFLLTLFGCSNEVPQEFDWSQLTRVDVQIFTGENNSIETLITEKEKMLTLRELFAKIKWEQNVKAEMVRKEDVKASLFFTYDKDMPERIFEYAIWFNQRDKAATIIDKEKNALGTLIKEDAQKLKDTLVNNKKSK
ncbi:hypothetical protein [Cytobacillus praedii]|uniref:Lipoprotein n=1 Tax=Cytobacillus praedii TaxID=1742358 RepID=A0A4V2NUD1_9BACI|nr:hypothetical protein [Cytobacillus praedii]TCJ03904.1 hypothetical protein E0Y62_12055 [Cytobacillus praedii]